MSQRNGDKSRFQISRKRGVKRREKVRTMLAAVNPASSEKQPAPAAKGPAKA